MKIHITGDAFVITSSISVKDIESLKKNAPTKLKMYEGEGENQQEIFAIGYNEGRPSISKFGVTFGGKDAREHATLTALIPAGVADRKEYVADVISPITAKNIKAMERSIKVDAKEIADARKELADAITETTVTE